MGAAAVVVLLLGLSQLSRIVGPFFLALNLMVVVWPVQRWLSRRVPRVLAAIVSGLLSIVIIGLLFWAIGWAASLFVQEIPQYKGQFQTMYDDVLNLAAQFGVTSTQIIDQLKQINPGSVVSVVSSLISNVGGAVSLFVIVITVLLFMVVDSVDFEARLERLGRRHNPVLVLALESFAQGVRKYWVTSTIFGLVVSTLTWAGLAAYGIPLAIVWAVLAFVTNYIPNIGFVIGLVPAAVMGLLAKGPWGALFVIVLYAVLNFVIQGVIQPKVAGEAVGVTSTVSFLSLLIWAVVLGPLGALLALPATLFVKALVVDADPKARWVNALIASNPKTSAEEPALGADTDLADSVVPAAVSQESDLSDEVPRRSLGVEDDQESETDEEAVTPRHSADPVEDEPTTADEPVAEHALVASEPVVEQGVDVPMEAEQEMTAADEPVTKPEALPSQEAEPHVEQPVEDEVVADAVGDEPVADAEEDEPVALTAGDEPPADAEVHEAVPATEEDEPVADAEEDESADGEEELVDAPRRARIEPDTRVSDDEEAVGDEFPLFQKSATPYWTGALSHDD